MRRAFAFYHRMNQPTLQLEPVIGLLLQIRDRMLAEEFWTDLLLRCFAGQRFDAVLAKLEHVTIAIRIRPGATLAIEPIFFIDLEPIANGARKTRFARGEFQTFGEGVHSGRHPIRCAQFHLPLFFGWLCSGLGVG